MRRSALSALSSASVAALGLALASPATAQTPASEQPGVQTQDCAVIENDEAREACMVAQQSSPAAADAAEAEAADTSEANNPATEEAIVVTGSRIPRPNFDTSAPAIVVNSEQIENRGFETIGQALNEQPSFGVPGSSPVGGQAGSFGSGQSFVNFLGLGSQRTLVLVNGRRFVSSNTASIFGPAASGLQVDLNGINTKLVERVETIAIGGAPIYGSDAIAGTINIITKDDYEGFEIDGQYGISSRGDVPNYRIRAIAGHNFAGGRGNVTLTGEYNEGEGLLYNDREITRQGLFYGDCPEDSPFSQCVFPNRRIPSISESGIPTVGSQILSDLLGGSVVGLFPVSPEQMEFLLFGDPSLAFGVQDADGNQVQFDTFGNFIPIDFGQSIGCVPCGDFNIDFSGGNGFNLINTQQLLTDTKRYNATLLAHFDITDNIRLFGEAWYSRSEAVNLREQPVYNSGLFGATGTTDGPIIISLDNPFLTEEQRDLIADNIENNPFSERNIICTFFGVQCGAARPEQDFFYLTRANTDIISGRAESKTDIYRFVAGLDGTFDLGTREMNWQVSGNYGRADSQGREPALVQQNFLNAVDAVDEGVFNGGAPNGNIICRPGHTNANIETLNPTCAPLNLFGNGVLSDAARDYITAIADPSSVNEQYNFIATVAGPVIDLPGGALNIALGYEHRQESTEFEPGEFFFGDDDPDPLVDANNDGDPTNDRVQFGRSIPIFPVSGKYNTDEVFGEATAEIISPSNSITGIYRLELHGAARWVDHSAAGGDLTWTVEGRYAPIRDIAFRANYTRAIRAPAITELFNPSSSFFSFATDPCDQENLDSGPAPETRQANCAAAGLDPDFDALSDDRSFPQAIAGNVELENEKSKAYSLGVVLTPRFVPGLRVSVDYLNVTLNNAITSFSATSVVNSCYDSTSFPDNAFCDLVSRDDSGQLDFVITSYFNAASYRYKGFLGALDYRTDVPFIGPDAEFGVNMTYQYLDTLTLQSLPTSAPATLHGTLGYPRHSAVTNFALDTGPVLFTTTLNYTGSVDQFADEPMDFRQFQKLNDVMFVNAGVHFDINERMTMRLLVDNVFDKDPPGPVPAAGGVVTYFPGVLGRYFRVGASAKF